MPKSQIESPKFFLTYPSYTVIIYCVCHDLKKVDNTNVNDPF